MEPTKTTFNPQRDVMTSFIQVAAVALIL